jgi:hypothetical protein
MSNLKSCERCGGFVPSASESCPNCKSGRAWWRVPLAIAGAGFATVTLSACYGPACVTQVKLPDGTTHNVYANGQCQFIDCTAKGADGGLVANDPEFAATCQQDATDAGSDAGVRDGGVSDAGP